MILPSRTKVFVGLFVVAFVALMWWAASPQSPDCEHLYNEYTSTVNMHDRDALFAQGMDNGCFHYN